MRALEFFINGQRVGVAAPGEDGLIMSHVLMTGTEGHPDKGEVLFRVGGVLHDHHLEWVSRHLAMGDKVEIRVIDALQSDPPVSMEPISSEQHERLRLVSEEIASQESPSAVSGLVSGMNPTPDLRSGPGSGGRSLNSDDI